MTPLSIEQLRGIYTVTPRARLELFLEPLEATFAEFSIDTLGRRAAFLAQVGHESAGLHYLRELASGAAYDTGRLAERLGNTPEADGDGQRFRGWGLIQITGQKNTLFCSRALFGDDRLISDPSLIDPPEPLLACRSAGWFWTAGARLNLSKRAQAHFLAKGVPVETLDLNQVADLGDFEGVTLAINGGLNGWDDRMAYFRRAQAALA